MYHVEIREGDVPLMDVRIGSIADDEQMRRWFVEARTPEGLRLNYGEFKLHKLDHLRRVIATAMQVVASPNSLEN